MPKAAQTVCARGNPNNWPQTCALGVLEYLARSGTVTKRAEFAPITELNWEMMPQAKTEVGGRSDWSSNLSAETPPLAVVAQQTTPIPARGNMMDLTLNRWRIFEVWMSMNGRVKRKASKKPTRPWVVICCSYRGFSRGVKTTAMLCNAYRRNIVWNPRPPREDTSQTDRNELPFVVKLHAA